MPKIQAPFQFLQDFHSSLEKAEYRIYIQSMNFEDGEVIQSLKPLLIQKAQNGVDVRIKIDWVAKKYVKNEGVAFLPAFSRKEYLKRKGYLQSTEILIQELLEGGVHVEEIHRPSFHAFFLTIFGRDHKKIYLIDEKVAWIGGVNLVDSALLNVDCMIKCEDPSFIDAITNAFVSCSTVIEDKVYNISSDHRLLLDGGKRNSSIIYDTALVMAQRSQRKIIFMSQFLPDGPLLELFFRKKLENVDVQVYTSPESTHDFHKLPYALLFKKTKEKLEMRGIPIHFLTKKVHAKVLLVDDSNVLIGSHNLVQFGVKLGTSEIALWSQDVNLLQSFREFFYSYVMKYDINTSKHIPNFI